MRMWRSAILIGCLLLVTACGGGSWIHPTKPQEEFAQDYNKCEQDVIKDPKLQQGQRYLVLQATERCVKKKGWQIKEAE
jgi:hypothetical protein